MFWSHRVILLLHKWSLSFWNKDSFQVVNLPDGFFRPLGEFFSIIGISPSFRDKRISVEITWSLVPCIFLRVVDLYNSTYYLGSWLWKKISGSPLRPKVLILVFLLKGAVLSCLHPIECQLCRSCTRKILHHLDRPFLCNDLNFFLFVLFLCIVSSVLYAFCYSSGLGGVFSLSYVFLGLTDHPFFGPLLFANVSFLFASEANLPAFFWFLNWTSLAM